MEERFYSPYDRRWDSTLRSNFSPGIPFTEVSVALGHIFFFFLNLTALAINCTDFPPLSKFTSKVRHSLWLCFFSHGEIQYL